ncbi:hypothetical protein [Paenibacillus sp. MMS18-CY102]|uniref:hypothetical protein n=1 Tax=Paenibacillus sp. MMS18-CY102 TaxID=2682849 RepID=UPI001366432B|nr:hypothetical protein [Paenibacillus sp. MMS18-CY102]MWC30949.1 hypothetical protein [Paenibacillus sp. MMS18-CY102]
MNRSLLQRTLARASWNRKLQALALMLLATGLVVTGGCGNPVAQADTMVLSSDVRADIHSMEQPVMTGAKLPLPEGLVYGDILWIQNDTMLFNRKDGLYTASLQEEGRMRRLLDTPAVDVSANGKLALYNRGKVTYLYDTETGKSQAVLDKGQKAYKKLLWDGNKELFADSEGQYVVFTGEIGVLYVADTASGELLTVKLHDYFELDQTSYSYDEEIQIHDDGLYIRIGGTKVKTGLYKITIQDKLPKAKLLIDSEGIGLYHPLPNGRLIFDGEYDHKSGIFIYNEATAQFTTLISKPVDEQNPVRVGYSYSLSPDEQQLLVHDVEHETISHWELESTQLANQKIILQGYPLYAIIPQLTFWNNDSKIFYIQLIYNNGTDTTNAVRGLSKYQL